MLRDLHRFWPPRRLGSLSGGGRAPGLPRAPATPDTAILLFAGHSMDQTPWGGVTSDGYHGGILYSDWPGPTLSDFVSFGSAQQVWELNGNLRNSPYDVVIASEVTLDFVNGYPALDSSSAANTMQHLGWYAAQAARRDAELVMLMPWSGPVTGDLDANGARFFEGIRRWLEAHYGRPVWIIPAGPFVAACRAAGYSDGDIYTDGLHLRQQFARGVSYLTYSFLTQQRCPFVRPGDEAVDQIAWEILTNWECAGMGGTITIPVPAYVDPLPNPRPWSALTLDTAPGALSALTLSNVTDSKMSALTTNSGRRVVSWPVSWPEGTVVSFDLTNSHTFYARLDDDDGLNNPGTVEFQSGGFAPGTNVSVSYTVTAAGAARGFFGFLMVTGGASFSISNFRVRLP